MSYRRPLLALTVATLVTTAAAWGWSISAVKFDHSRHSGLFSSCDGCHTVEATGVTFPEPSFCQGCHNGQIAPEIAWEGPSRRIGKFGFNHAETIAAKEMVGEEASCASCHLAPGGGPMDVRRAPAFHTPFFAEQHATTAPTRMADCETCHVRDQQCLGCHTGSQDLKPAAGNGSGYHPEDFLARHSSEAWNQEVECSSCHNPEAYCRSCHLQEGSATQDFRTTTGYHNDSPNFTFGHGQAARQGLESCASCHAQSDCLACHSATEGRRINPHGSDFDAKKLRDKNPELCLFCHYSSILERPL